MKIAISQMTSGIDPLENADALVAAIAQAAQDGAEIIFTPEMSGLLDRDRARSAAHMVVEAHDQVLAAVCEAARTHAITVMLGSLALLPQPGANKRVNRSFVINSAGAIIARYDKIHLFDVDLGPGQVWRESDAFDRGQQAVVADMGIAKIGLSVCYDLRFPDLYSRLAEAGAEILSIPAAFTVPTGEAHWHVLQRARAIETGCFVVAAAQSGAHADGRKTYGHSLVIDPWGRVLLDMGRDSGLSFCTIDLNEIAAVRAKVPSLANRQHIGAAAVAA